MSEHTPLPWRAYRDVIVSDTPSGEFQTTAVAYYGDEMRHNGGLPFGAERDANAALIVKAVNSHDALVKALEEIAADHKTYKGHGDYDEGPHPADYCQFLAREALAKAATS